MQSGCGTCVRCVPRKYFLFVCGSPLVVLILPLKARKFFVLMKPSRSGLPVRGSAARANLKKPLPVCTTQRYFSVFFWRLYGFSLYDVP